MKLALGNSLATQRIGGAAAFVGPLDDYAADGLLFYSTRRLLTAFEGVPQRMRLNPGSDEADIGFSADWLDVSAAERSTLLGSSGGAITTWYDQLGNRNLANATTTQQPDTQIAGTPVSVNSRQAITGTGDSGTTKHLATTSFAHGIGTGDFFLSLIVKYVSGSSSNNAVFAGTGYTPIFYTKATGTPKPTIYWGDFKIFDSTLVTDTTYILSFGRESGTLKAWVNGVQEATTHALATSLATTEFWIFNGGDASIGNSGADDIQEILFFGSALASARDAIMADQKAHAGIA